MAKKEDKNSLLKNFFGLVEEEHRDVNVKEYCDKYCKDVAKDLIEEKEFSNLLINSLPGVFYLFNKKGRFLRWNKNVSKITGYSEKEIAKMNPLDFISAEDRSRMTKIVATAFKKGWASAETKLATKSGEIIPFYLTGALAKIDGKEYVTGIGIDISEKFELEKENIKIQNLLNETGKMAKVGGWEFDVETMQQKWTDEVYEIHELDKEKFKPDVKKGVNFYDKKSKSIIAKAVEDAIKYGKPFDLELGIITAKGNQKKVRAIGKAEKENGKIKKVYGTFQDITKLKRAETDLKESLEKYRLIAQNSTDVIYILNLKKNKYEYVSPSVEQTFGYTQKEALALPPDSVITPESLRLQASELKKALKKGGEDLTKSKRLELEAIKKDGSKMWVEINARLLLDNKKRPYAILGAIRDISDKKKIEEELRDSEAKYKAWIDQAGEAFYMLDTKGRYIYANKEGERLTGYTVEEMRDKSLLSIVPKSEFFKVLPKVTHYLTHPGEVFPLTETVIKKSDGTLVPMISRFVPYYIRGKLSGFMGISLDITNRKQDELKIKENEERIRSILNTAPYGIAEINNKAEFEYANQYYFKLIGYKPEELVGRRVSDFFPSKKNTQEFNVYIKNLVKKKSNPEPWIGQVKKKDGKVIDIQSNWQYKKNSKGNVVGFVIVTTDITEKKKVEKEMKDSEEKYRYLFENSLDYLIGLDSRGRIININNAALEAFEYEKKDLLGRRVTDFIPKKYVPLAIKNLTLEFLGKKTSAIEIEFANKSGKLIPLEVGEGSIPIYESGKRAGILLTARDITERKAAERALRESEEKYRRIVEFQSDLVFTMDKRGRVTSISGPVEKYGYKPEEIVGTTFADAIPRKNLPGAFLDFRRVMKGEKVKSETALLDKNGKPYYVEFINMPLYEDGKIVGTSGIIKEINEKKKAELALQQSEEKYKSITEHTADIVFELNLEGVLTSVSGNTGSILGVKAEKMVGRHFQNKIAKEEQAKVFKLFKQVLKGKTISADTIMLNNKNDKRYVHFITFPIIEEGKQVAIRGIIQDMTDRKEFEEKLLESEGKYKDFFHKSEIAMLEMDAKGMMLDVNEHLCKICMRPKEYFIGTHFAKPGLFTASSILKAMKNYALLLRTGKNPLVYYDVNRGDGKVVNILASVNSYYRNNKLYRIYAVFSDVTKEKEAEKLLEENERKLHYIFNQSYQFIGIMTLDGILIEANETAIKLTGYSKNKIIGKKFWDTPWWTHSRELQNKLKEAVQKGVKGEASRFEATHFDAKGGAHYVDFSLTPAKDKNGKIIYLIPEGRDITEIKKATEELKVSEKRFKDFFDYAGVAMIEMSPTGVLLDANKKAEEIAGAPFTTRSKGKHFSQPGLFTAGSIIKALKNFPKVLKTGYAPLEYYDVHQQNTGKTITIGATISTYREEGRVKKIYIVFSDVTKEKEAEKQLKEQEEKFRSIFEGADEGIVLVDPKTKKFILGNSRFQLITGRANEEIVKLSIADIHPKKDLPFVFSQFNKLIKGDIDLVANTPVLNKKGKIIYCDISMSPVEIGGQKLAVGFFREMTEVKKAEERYMAIFKFSADAIMTIDPPVWKFTSGNPAALKMYGVKNEEEFKKLGPWDLSPEKQNDGQLSSVKAKIMIEEAMRKGEKLFEWTHKGLNGENFPTEILLNRVEIGDRKFLQATVRDLTEIKKAQEEINKLADIVKSSNDAIISEKFDGTIVSWNVGAERLYGYTAEEAIGKNLSLIIPTGYDDKTKEILEKVKSGKIVEDYETFRKNKKGEILNVSLSASPIKDGNKIIAASAIARDITEKKRSEEIVKKNEEFLRYVTENVPSVIYQLKLEKNGKQSFAFVSQRAEEMFEIDINKIKADFNLAWNLILLDDQEKMKKSIMESAKNLKQWEYEFRIKIKSGKIKWIGGVSEPKPNQADGSIIWTGAFTDITAKKEADKKFQDKAGELSRMNSLMVGRELKMIELKKKVEELEKKLGGG
ncbi:MAG: PAS domain S-box protein [Patescibacteria group bacterium]|nr:PAS domain S-box protein [Patescibacteria group bacterium]MDD4610988.1 PAS domain S-box protein [Patescibacteria group bacterium]